MTIKELIKKYYFHDSCITYINYLSNISRLEITIDFCQWAQSWYKDDMPENILIKLVLSGIDTYNGIIGDTDYYSILNVDTDNNNKLWFYILDDIHDKEYEYVFTPSDIEIEIIDETN